MFEKGNEPSHVTCDHSSFEQIYMMSGCKEPSAFLTSSVRAEYHTDSRFLEVFACTLIESMIEALALQESRLSAYMGQWPASG